MRKKFLIIGIILFIICIICSIYYFLTHKIITKDLTNYVEQTAKYNKDVTLVFPNGVGYEGAISAPFLEEASNYTGYHIVLYTGKLKSVVANTLNTANLFEKLSKVKTSIAYNQNYFEYLYDLVAKDNYSAHVTDVVGSIKVATEYTSANYSDLY